MKMQRASVLVLGFLGATASCAQIVLPEGDDYRARDTTLSSGASPGAGSGGDQATSMSTSSAPASTTTGSTGAGTPSCDSGYTSCGGECVLIANDSRHCGSCERDCQGQPCEASMCAPRVIADKQVGPSYIALDASSIYWANWNDGTLFRAALDGSGVMKLGGGQGPAEGIALQGGFVYWANYGDMVTNGTIKRVPVAGGNPETVASGEQGPESLVVTPTHLFWSDFPDSNDPNYVRKKALAGGSTAVTITPTAGAPWSVASDGKNVYAASAEGLLMKFSSTGDAPATLTKGAYDAQFMAIAGGYIYYTNYRAGMVGRVSIDGGAPEIFYDGASAGVTATYGIAVDDKYVYWTEDEGGIVRKAPMSGGPWKPSTTTVLAVGQGIPNGIAVDGAYVYWANYANGLVLKTPK